MHTYIHTYMRVHNIPAGGSGRSDGGRCRGAGGVTEVQIFQEHLKLRPILRGKIKPVCI